MDVEITRDEKLKQKKKMVFKIVLAAYSGDTRSPFPVISVHFLFIFLLTGVKLILFS